MLNITSKIRLNTTVTSLSLHENFLLVTSADKKFRIYDLESEKCIIEVEGHNYGVNQGLWDMYGEYILTCSDDGTIKIWSKSGKQVSVLIGHSNYVQSLAIDPKNLMLLSGGSDCSVILWDLRSTQQITNFFHVHQEPVTSLGFSDDSSVFLTGSFDGTIHLWDTMSLNSLKTCSFNRNVPITRAKFIGPYMYSSCLDSKILLWSATEVKSIPIKQYTGHINECYTCDCIAIKTGQIYSGSEDGGVYIWDLNTADIPSKIQVFPRNRILNVLDVNNNTFVASSFDASDFTNYEHIVIGKIC
ncbi:hypothetical protein SteCoe_9454 [Stentor coeruleus]|uniref:Uncharacterized protein n=1 Tax=Stentor coeruleus TaxID=5963 RepID=A0A1R2CI09_9CILI|nr:hypothetical protein SteCoe_9454 [Stentor coeruleus]